MKRGQKIKQMLITLAAGAKTTIEFLDEIWPVGFTKSHYLNRKRAIKNASLSISFNQKQEFYNLLNYLKRTGLVDKKNNETGAFWKITSNGLNKLGFIKNRELN